MDNKPSFRTKKVELSIKRLVSEYLVTQKDYLIKFPTVRFEITEVKVSKDKAYVGEQVKLTYTFYTRIASKVLSTEFPEYNDFWVEKLFDPVGIKFTPESWDDIEIDGYSYKSLKIYEVALFPLQEGVYTLESMIMKIETKNKDSSFNRLFWDCLLYTSDAADE